MEYIVLVDMGASVEVYRRNTEGSSQLVGIAAKPGGYLVENTYIAPACGEVVWFGKEFDEASGEDVIFPAWRSQVSASLPPAPVDFSGNGRTGIVQADDVLILWSSVFSSSTTVQLDPPSLLQPSNLAIEFGRRVNAKQAIPARCADGAVRLVALDDLGTTGYVSTDVGVAPITVAASFAVPSMSVSNIVANGAAVMVAASAVSPSPFIVAGSSYTYDGELSQGLELRSEFSFGFGHNLAAGTVERVSHSGFSPPFVYTYEKYTVDTSALTQTLVSSQVIDQPRNAYYAAPPVVPPFWTSLKSAVEIV